MKNKRKNPWTVAGAAVAVLAFGILILSVLGRMEESDGNTYPEPSADEAAGEREEGTQVTEPAPGTEQGAIEEETEEGAEDGDEILRRFSSMEWDRLEPARIGQDEDWQTRVVFLAELQEEEIIMYGYNDEEFSNRGVAIDFKGNVSFFDWIYMTSRLDPPRLYWQEKGALLQAAMEVGAGSGYAVQELHVLQAYETGHLEPYSFDGDTYVPLLKERIGFRWEPETQTLVLFDTVHPEEALASAELGWLEPERIDGLSLGESIRFELGEEIWLECTPGFLADGMPMPQFDGMPRLRAQVLVTPEAENGQERLGFSLGQIRAEQD